MIIRRVHGFIRTVHDLGVTHLVADGFFLGPGVHTRIVFAKRQFLFVHAIGDHTLNGYFYRFNLLRINMQKIDVFAKNVNYTLKLDSPSKKSKSVSSCGYFIPRYTRDSLNKYKMVESVEELSRYTTVRNLPIEAKAKIIEYQTHDYEEKKTRDRWDQRRVDANNLDALLETILQKEELEKEIFT